MSFYEVNGHLWFSFLNYELRKHCTLSIKVAEFKISDL